MKLLRTWGPVGIWMILIFTGSAQHRFVVSENYDLNFAFFKTLHLIEYGILYFLIFRAMKLSYPKKKLLLWSLWAFIILIAYASTDEFHQLFVPTREGAIRDVIIDTVGGGLSWTILTKLLPKLPRKLQRWARILLI